jgi:hypothetical protein
MVFNATFNNISVISLKLNNKRTDAKEGVNCSPFSHIIDLQLQTGADAITIRSAYKSIIVFVFFIPSILIKEQLI